MKRLLPLVSAFGLACTTGQAMAWPAPLLLPTHETVAPQSVPVDYGHGPRHRPRVGNGGYRVNRYGFGNYVGGRSGFAGYPAGSAGARIYRQQEEWKCQNVPESC